MANIKKIFIFLTITITCLTLFFLLKKDNDLKIEEKILKPLKCDLNRKDCYFYFKDKKILVNLNPKPIRAFDVLNLKIQNLPNYKNPKIIIYGLNMYMGDITPKINKISDNTYEINFMLSQCTLETMRYRVQILNNNKKEFYFDFDVKR